MKLPLFISAFFISAFSFQLSALEPGPPARPYGAGTITRTSDGKTAVTSRYGLGTRTVVTSPGQPARSMVTTRYGHGSITRTSDGKTAITSRYGLRGQGSGARSQKR